MSVRRPSPTMRVEVEADMRHRIFILTPLTLLTRGVELLLTGRPSFQVIGSETDVARSLEQIQHLHPDVVILACGEQSRLSLQDVSNVFAASPGTAVISIGSNENLLHIYRDDQMPVDGVEDLVHAIECAQRAEVRAARRRGR